MAKNRKARRRQRIAKRNANQTSTPELAAKALRQKLARISSRLGRFLNSNPGGHSATDILAAFGAEAETLQGLLATGTALGQEPTAQEPAAQ